MNEFIISLIILLTTLAIVIKLYIKDRNISKKIICISILGLAGALMPFYYVGYRSLAYSVFDTVALSLFSVIDAIGNASTVFVSRELLMQNSTSSIQHLLNYISLIHLLIMIAVFSFVISFLKNYINKIRYKLLNKKTLLVFTEISEMTVFFAENIFKTRKNMAFAFLSSESYQNIEKTEFGDRINLIHGFILNETITSLDIPRRVKSSETFIFLFKMEEDKNLQDAAKISTLYTEKFETGKFNVHILNSSNKAPMVVDAFEFNENISYRIFNESKSLVQNLFTTSPLFLARNGNNLKVLIIGSSKTAYEAVKTAVWCGYTLELAAQITVISEDENFEELFIYDNPELKDEVKFYTIKLKSSLFVSTLKKHFDCSYIICADEDENTNLELAIKVRSILTEISYINDVHDKFITPKIHFLSKNEFINSISQNLKYDTKVLCDITPFGDQNEIYTWKNIVASYYDALGKSVNRLYYLEYEKSTLENLTEEFKEKRLQEIYKHADKDYGMKEHNRNASVAQGIHCKYKLYAILEEVAKIHYDDKLWEDNPTKDLIEKAKELLKDDTLVERLSKLEHTRWNENSKANGFKSASINEMSKWYKEGKNDYREYTARFNACITSWEKLDDLTGFIANHGKNVEFKALDRIMIINLCEILEVAESINNQYN